MSAMSDLLIVHVEHGGNEEACYEGTEDPLTCEHPDCVDAREDAAARAVLANPMARLMAEIQAEMIMRRSKEA